MRKLTEKTLVIATHNEGKLDEFKMLLAGRGLQILSAGALGLPEPEETGTTFLENATLKALAAAKASGHPALADDSGLCVAALGDQPGVQTARWGGPSRDFVFAMNRVQNELGAAQDRSARFVCTLVMAWPDGHTETVEGVCAGQIVWPMRGQGGHGYDPVFQPEGETQSFAEMPAEKKNEISHRAKAFAALTALLA